MQIRSDIRSPNFSDLDIRVEFVVLHYTAASLERTLELFTSPKSEVSAHLVIDRDGTVYEMVQCLNGTAKRAWHAGRSRLSVSRDGMSKLIEAFNDFSVGIELVNLNGNVFSYTEKQYASLFGVIERLKGVYPALGSPGAIIGHEQIAGFRGKSDPGRRFEWQRLYSVCYPNQGAPERPFRCSELVVQRLSELIAGMGIVERVDGVISIPSSLPNMLFGQISSFLEAALSDRDG
jgi:N-acetyl-anhydromuramyl-L-alanine amidase AmpD